MNYLAKRTVYSEWSLGSHVALRVMVERLHERELHQEEGWLL